MRKCSAVPRAVVPITMVLVLSLAACGRGDRASRTTSGRSTAKSSATSTASVDTAAYANALDGRVRRELAIAGAPMESPVEGVVAGGAGDAMVAAAPAASVSPQRGTAASAPVDFVHGSPLPTMDATGAMLVRHGQAAVQVKSVDAALGVVRQTAGRFGGFVANTSVRTGRDEQRSATLELRVPSDRFDGLLSELSSLGKVESVTANAEDVAEEYVDLGARAANARRVEARLVEMLATRTGKLSDVLTVEQELARVRMEAERYDARLRWLERRATLSSLDITIHEPIALLDHPRGPGPIAEALAEAWTRTIGVLAWCIASLGLLVPLGILVGIGVVVARRVIGAKKRELVGELP